MIPSILCYVPPSVEFLGPTTLSVFQASTYDTPVSNQIDAPAAMRERKISSLSVSDFVQIDIW